MDWLHVLLAFAAGGGLFLSWGYRTALHVALGRDVKGSAPKPAGGVNLPAIAGGRRD